MQATALRVCLPPQSRLNRDFHTQLAGITHCLLLSQATVYKVAGIVVVRVRRGVGVAIAGVVHRAVVGDAARVRREGGRVRPTSGAELVDQGVVRPEPAIAIVAVGGQ